MATLAEQIREFRDWVKDHKPKEYGKAKEPPEVAVKNTGTDLSEDAAEIGRKMLAAAMADRMAYDPTPNPGVQLHKESIGEALGNPTAVDKDGEPMYALDSAETQYMLEVLAPYTQSLREYGEIHGLGIASIPLASNIFPQGPLSRFNEKLQKSLGLDGQILFRKLSFELEAARNNPEQYHTSTPVVQKIQRGVQVYTEGRASDALTILETIRNEEPHNKLVSYVLSNIYYHRAAHGNRKFLPQAREEAKKAASHIDKIAPEVIHRFRYNYIAVDGYFGPERQLDVLREFGFFVPPAPDAPAIEHAHYIKCMIYLSLTEFDDWSDKDVKAVRTMTEKYIGGGLLFAMFYEQKALPFIFNDNADVAGHFAPLKDTLHTLQLLQHNLSHLKQVLAESFAENVEQTPPEYWTINRRLVRLAAKSLPMPELSMFLANTSLDGEEYTQTPTLDRVLRESELELGEYWDFWVHKINYMTGVFNPNVMPEHVALDEQEILPKIVAALEDLRRQERKLINEDRWALCSHHQPKYTYENLVEIGLGHAFTPMSFAPKLQVLKNHYQIWGAVMPTALLPSEIIVARAKSGSFANINEVVAAIDGAHKILTDSEYGIPAQQRKAWEIYLKMQQQAESSKHGNSALNEILSEIWWFFLIILGALLAFTLVAASESMEAGMRMFITVMLAGIIFVGGVIAYQRLLIARTSGKYKSSNAADTAQHEENGDEPSLQDLANNKD